MEDTEDCAASARAAGLRYVSDHRSGIRRENSGAGFRYRRPGGGIIRKPDALKRINSLAIPPAWTEVWICADPKGHLQATGFDARGRKQYRYHPRWREVRDDTKYERMLGFGKALPGMRRRLRKDLALPGLPRVKVLAAVVRLLEESLIRVGNEEYVRENNTFGLTTMQERHVDVHGALLHFEFNGKGGKRHRIDIRDRRVARIIKKCEELPGQDLFQYLDARGERQTLRSTDVNAYLKEISGKDFTAKDFRTWAGSVLAAKALQKFEKFASGSEAKRNIVCAIRTVADRLGNTPAICRKCYVHPAVIEAYLKGKLEKAAVEQSLEPFHISRRHLRQQEADLLKVLKRSLAATSARA